MSSLAVDTMWTALAVVLIESMRLGALLLTRARRAAQCFRRGSLLLAVTVPLGLTETVLAAVHAVRALRITAILLDIGIQLGALGCVVLGTALLMGGLRPPRGPRRRAPRRGNHRLAQPATA